MDNIESYSVHVSREDAFITVVFSPNTRCGEGIKGGGGRVTLTSGTLKILQVKGYE